MVSDRIRDKRLAAASVAFVVYTMVMLLLERRMRATGGPGVIRFELAGSASQAEDIMTRWGSDGQPAERLSLWLDFGYMATYGAFTSLLVDRARRRRGHPAPLLATVIVAVAADATEGSLAVEGTEPQTRCCSRAARTDRCDCEVRTSCRCPRIHRRGPFRSRCSDRHSAPGSAKM